MSGKTITFYVIFCLVLVLAVFIEFVIIGTMVSHNRCASLYDYQSTETFIGNFSSLSYNVYVINQSDDFGMGPGYLLNGLTNKGYWYQVGIGYNWSKFGYVHSSGFSMLSYLEFQTSTNSTSLGNTIHPNDKVLLSMYFENNSVILKIHDWNTGSSKEISFPAFNATYFVGGPYKDGVNNGTADYQGHFTGLMTEWWHADIYGKNTTPITYEPYTTDYNAIQLSVNDRGPYPTNTKSTSTGSIFSMICSADIHNLMLPSFSRFATSGIIKINSTSTYNYSPYKNITLSIHGLEFITR